MEINGEKWKQTALSHKRISRWFMWRYWKPEFPSSEAAPTMGYGPLQYVTPIHSYLHDTNVLRDLNVSKETENYDSFG